MVPEVLSVLGPSLDGFVIDATVGCGGHAEALLKASPRCSLLGLDRDPSAVEYSRKRLAPFGSRARVQRGNFEDIAAFAESEGASSAGAVLMDLGTSSLQLSDPERGFSFMESGPLDMRMDRDEGATAADLLHKSRESELADLIFKFGEDRNSRRIARRIVAMRERGEMKTTADLARAAGPSPRGGHSRIHPATRLFQAVRIAVNRELEALERALPAAVGVLRPGGRIAVISFHSLEDRTVKRFLVREGRDCVCPPEFPQCVCGHKKTVMSLVKKPLTASDQETAENPRARSAKLRAAERV